MQAAIYPDSENSVQQWSLTREYKPISSEQDTPERLKSGTQKLLELFWVRWVDRQNWNAGKV